MFIDRQQMVWLCGRFKISGDGSSGQVHPKEWHICVFRVLISLLDYSLG